MAEAMVDLAQWVASTPYSEFVRGTRSDLPMFLPVMLILHLLGITAIIGAATLVGLRLLGLAGRSMAVADVGRRMLPWIWTALPLMVLTGLTVLCYRPQRYLTNPGFAVKMLLLVTAITLTLGLHRSMVANGAAWDASGRRGKAALAGGALLLAWAATLFAGRWLPYV